MYPIRRCRFQAIQPQSTVGSFCSVVDRHGIIKNYREYYLRARARVFCQLPLVETLAHADTQPIALVRARYSEFLLSFRRRTFALKVSTLLDWSLFHRYSLCNILFANAKRMKSNIQHTKQRFFLSAIVDSTRTRQYFRHPMLIKQFNPPSISTQKFHCLASTATSYSWHLSS